MALPACHVNTMVSGCLLHLIVATATHAQILLPSQVQQAQPGEHLLKGFRRVSTDGVKAKMTMVF